MNFLDMPSKGGQCRAFNNETWGIGYSPEGVDIKYTEMKAFFGEPSSGLPMRILR